MNIEIRDTAKTTINFLAYYDRYASLSIASSSYQQIQQKIAATDDRIQKSFLIKHAIDKICKSEPSYEKNALIKFLYNHFRSFTLKCFIRAQKKYKIRFSITFENHSDSKNKSSNKKVTFSSQDRTPSLLPEYKKMRIQ